MGLSVRCDITALASLHKSHFREPRLQQEVCPEPDLPWAGACFIISNRSLGLLPINKRTGAVLGEDYVLPTVDEP